MGQKFYMEVRGSMTRFEPLTEAALNSLETDLTFTELVQMLDACDLSIDHVVHDPGRKFASTFYADYEKGLYLTLYPGRKYLKDHLSCTHLETWQQKAAAALERKTWPEYYRLYVPVPMLIYDFQQRYQDISPAEVFSVWHSIYKRIGYSNGMWNPDILEYVFSQASPPSLPPADADGRVTLYRGMGALSQPPEKAISWSTHPGNALWVATHFGQGTHIVVAKVRPEDIVAYDEGYRVENEVILRPGTEKEWFYEDMIPAVKETVPLLLAPTLLDFTRYGCLAFGLGYPEENDFQIHGVRHVLRVLLLSLLYIHHSGDLLTEADRQILIYFSLLHDIGRVSDGREPTHGAQSVELIHKKGIRLRGIRLSRKDYRIAELLIRCHCLDDQEGITEIHATLGLSLRDKKRACKLYEICKDMDGLDRIRFNGWITGFCGRSMPAACR
ncbi:HD domain-containing protein [uncultured Oscillibacter sp.]|uniref:HD domain-containing protein n=1 Tax=uncultured Oscillibacter sp. TaxID=876091 RepID=UPI0025E8F31F|nr:HD domain-containing protein [uncultured Oscillibacter sp.]